MTDSSLTFVTAYINIYGDKPFEDKTHEWRFAKFRVIAETGIQLAIYVSADCHDLLCNFIKEFPNVRIMRVVNIDETFAAEVCDMVSKEMTDSEESEPFIFDLPSHRNEPKDIHGYIHLINSKVAFMADTIAINPWNSTHFAWIDFSISYVFHDIPRSQAMLRAMSRRKYAASFLSITGCWPELVKENLWTVLEHIHWRFCGGFFIGDRASILDFYDRYCAYFPQFLKEHKKLVWEVNFWAWLEMTTDWRPQWFKGDHNDTILHMCSDFFSECIADQTKEIVKYEYPSIETYLPMSACHMFYQGEHWLNTRYVNYWYLDSGHCVIEHPDNHIITKNMISRLNGQTMIPTDYREMDDATVGLPSNACYFYGLEDIRLFESNGQMRFIATNINYSPTGRNRMIVGDFDPVTATYSNCIVTMPPNPDSWCEKNWIPLVRKDMDTGRDAEFFIYKWWPMEIGQLDPETNQLAIVETFTLTAPLFDRVRGSSPFIEWGEFLIGVVHFSEEFLPRHYYHMMVMLDKKTFRPVKYSRSFCFQRVGIEFCIGLTVRDGDYLFWISQFDREPVRLTVPMDVLPFVFDF